MTIVANVFVLIQTHILLLLDKWFVQIYLNIINNVEQVLILFSGYSCVVTTKLFFDLILNSVTTDTCRSAYRWSNTLQLLQWSALELSGHRQSRPSHGPCLGHEAEEDVPTKRRWAREGRVTRPRHPDQSRQNLLPTVGVQAGHFEARSRSCHQPSDFAKNGSLSGHTIAFHFRLCGRAYQAGQCWRQGRNKRRNSQNM